MPNYDAGTNDSGSRAFVRYSQDVLQYDAANNRTLVRIGIGVFDNSPSLGGNGTGTWSIGFLGVQRNSGSVSYDFGSGSPGTLWTGDFWVDHDASGYANIYGSAFFNGVSPVGAAGVSGSFVVDYVRLPGAPGTPTLSRNSNGTSISITSQVPSSPVSITAYQYAYRTDNSNWSSAVDMGNSTTASFAAPSATTAYYFITRAYSSEGWGAWSPSAYIAGIPTAPASISATRTARNVAVTCTAPSSDGGSAVSGYFVQYSTNGGTSWSTAQAMTSQAYTYTNLTAALTYTFRVYATNAIGNSAATSSNPLFVPAGGKRWDGTNWVSTTIAKRWDGTTWVDLTIAKRWDGTNWVDLS